MKLLFVYNAKSGRLNALLDAGHKLFSPKTYQCSLCALTFDTFTEKEIWKTFREGSSIDMEFYHIDEFEEAFPDQSFDYPVVLKQSESGLILLIDRKKLNATKNVTHLIEDLQLLL